MATPNYGYEKRQKELAKKRKKEDKLKEKAHRKQSGLPDYEEQPSSSSGDPSGNPGAGNPGQS